MTIKLHRKPFRIGSSYAVTLPASWCEYYGEQINTLTIYGNSVLILAPIGLERLARELITRAEAKGGEGQSAQPHETQP